MVCLYGDFGGTKDHISPYDKFKVLVWIILNINDYNDISRSRILGTILTILPIYITKYEHLDY